MMMEWTSREIWGWRDSATRREQPSFDEWDLEGKLLGQQHEGGASKFRMSKGFTGNSVDIVCCRGIWHRCWGLRRRIQGARFSSSTYLKLAGLGKKIYKS